MKGAKTAAGFGSWLKGFAGVPEGGVFGKPSWVDASKPPGHTSQAEQLGVAKTFKEIATLQHFFFSPNFVWFSITVVWYNVMPYDLEAAAKGWAASWVLRRLAANFALAFAYYGFWFGALDLYGRWSKRKFLPGVYPTLGNMAHDLWYWNLAILQWTLSECAMTRLWATGRLPYASDKEVVGSATQLLVTVFWILLVPLWRDVHFYVCHRFSHIRALYKYVHSLHHRNPDPEPFSGMCMHPIEHLLYFSNALVPAVYLRVSPFIYMWVFVHLTLAPGASHSGWEDHWHADQYHYIHHAKFECNYGSGGTGWVDQFFGTFREKLGSSGAYKGEYKEDYADKKATGKVWSAQSYLGLQERDHALYSLFCLSATAALVWAVAVNPGSASPVRSIGPVPVETAMASLVAYGPVVFALLLCVFYDKMSWRWPFHKERVFGAFGLFVFLGWLACLLPIFHFVQLISAP